MFSILKNLFGSLFSYKREKSSNIIESRIGGNMVVGDNNIIGNSKENVCPEIIFHIIGPFRNGGAGLELYNSGTEDVTNIGIKIGWHQDNEPKKQERDISQLRFINENDDPVLTHASPSLTILRKGEKKIALGVPNIAVRKKVAIRIKCIGLKSKTLFDNKKNLKTLREYPNLRK